MKTGIELIAEERARQIEVEGFTPEHDAEHGLTELVQAARCYVRAGLVCLAAKDSEEAVRRMYALREAVPEEDEDFRRMMENPARYYFGWDRVPSDYPDEWPWEKEWWKPSPDAVVNFAKAGALLAAQIDRIGYDIERAEAAADLGG